MFSTLMSVAQLQSLQASQQPLRVFDCSFDLMQPAAGDAQYRQKHIDGAVRADLDRHLSTHIAAESACGGRHPLPTREVFARWLSSVGFDNAMQAVVYDRQGLNYCGRLWWMLKWAGHEAVAVLDGGLPAWEAAGGALASGDSPAPVAGHFLLAPARVALVATAQIAQQLGRPTQTIVDARGTPRYLGEVEPIDPVAGHIPGALNRPFGQNLAASGLLKPAHQLKAEFEALLAGCDPATVVHQCGSGVSAVPNLLAMEIAGLGRTALYGGSWSEWCSDPARPVAVG